MVMTIAAADGGGKIGADASSPIRLATDVLPREEQFDAWRAFMSPAIEFGNEGDLAGGFLAEQTVWDLGSLALSHALMPDDGRMRHWRHLKRDPLDHWCLVLVDKARPRGARSPSEGGRSLFVRSLARPFEGYGRDREVLSVYMPRDVFRGEAAAIDQLPDRLPTGPLVALLGDYLVDLHRRLPGIPARELPKLVEATRMLISACMTANGEQMVAAREVIAVSLIDRARKIVQQNLAAPNFGPPQLCRMLGVSRSRLYRLFEPLGGVSHYIQRQRLLAAHGALTDPLNNGRVAKIAERVGFADASGFSRAFKQEFGYSPSYARAMASLSEAAPTARLPLPRGEHSSLGDVLRRLGA